MTMRNTSMTRNDLPANAKMNKDVYGNWSRYANNWIGGPTHMQRQQMIPGYTGQVRGMVDKGSYSQSYARVTAALYARQNATTKPKKSNMFISTQRSEFKLSNNRRFAINKDMIPRKDYADYSKYVND